MAEYRKITVDDVSRGIDKGFDTGDEHRAASLESLQPVRKAKGASLWREHERLAIKYGPEHPRVQELAGRAALNQGFLSDLVIETTRAKTKIPVLDEATWILHGYVWDHNRNGFPKLTVALYERGDHTSNWVKELGFACTNDIGYFKLEAHNLKDYSSSPVFMRVLSREGQALYIATYPLTPQAGRLDYREVTIGGESIECTPPPAPTSNDEWIVRGHVADASEAALPGLVVSLSDKEQTFAARLGKTQTDPAGNFVLSYRAHDFNDLIAKKPDLFLSVSGGVLKQSYKHPTALRFKPGSAENVLITIKTESEGTPPWTVRGTVSDNTGAVLPGLTVSISDRERKLAERLGKTQTGANGKFEFIYQAKDFADLIEKPVELLLHVTDANNNSLYLHPTALTFAPGKTENIPIVIARKTKTSEVSTRRRTK